MESVKKLPFSVVFSQTRLKWESCGFIELLTSGNGVYLLMFKEESDCVEMLRRNHWTIVGAPLMLKMWEA